MYWQSEHQNNSLFFNIKIAVNSRTFSKRVRIFLNITNLFYKWKYLTFKSVKLKKKKIKMWLFPKLLCLDPRKHYKNIFTRFWEKGNSPPPPPPPYVFRILRKCILKLKGECSIYSSFFMFIKSKRKLFYSFIIFYCFQHWRSFRRCRARIPAYQNVLAMSQNRF